MYKVYSIKIITILWTQSVVRWKYELVIIITNEEMIIGFRFFKMQWNDYKIF